MRTLQDYQRAYQGQDKRLHFWGGVVFGAGGAAFIGMDHPSPLAWIAGGVAIAAAAGAIKEGIDYLAKREGSPYGVERADFTATVAGGVVGAALAALLRVVF